MKIEIWSDIACPFCYIGKRHLEAAIEQSGKTNEISIEWKSFQLDPNIPKHIENKQSPYEYLAKRKGITVEQSIKLHENVIEMAKKAGLEYHFEKAVVANSNDAHRMIQMAKTKGFGDAAEERLFMAYFMEGKNLSDYQTIIELGTDVGLTEAEVKESLYNDEYALQVNQDIREAQTIGVRGVPFFLFDRKYAISGAQPVAAFVEVLEKCQS